ncbi:hypothetical protein SAMN05444365_102339 [Micromonospora pattaloongensis]|uniref:PH domain-containing protein n=1 Tax=Micromonospora pattaloongensis TaxID=405436 RepID=A0A1H3K232_9ACTN|nr:hypothetical protein [Micromonospora pattaloongensis]SDY46257.1 hypothetical protein SAMN05444365_102339 [Micromonospora pattaloongensis]
MQASAPPPSGQRAVAPAPPVLARFRPTRRQAAGRGSFIGGLVAVALALVLLGAVMGPPLLDRVAGTRSGRVDVPPLAWLLLLLPVPVGALVGVRLRARFGADLDRLGMHGMPLALEGFAPWKLVVDIRPERRHRRTVVTVYLDDGTVLRPRAPYDGKLLGRDREFERKLFMICHVWETYRDWSVRV